MNDSHCITEEEFVLFKERRLPEEEFARILRHTAQCAPCRERLTEVCLTENDVVLLVEKRLAEEELVWTRDHVARCAACRTVLAEALRVRALVGKPELSPSRRTTEGPSADAFEDHGTDTWKPPDQFDEFTILRELGQGGMGVVYLAEDTKLHRQVAIKFIAAAEPTQRDRERFQIEAQAIARLQHPNVVTLFRVGEVEGRAYLVSEYINGQNLEATKRPMSWPAVVHIGRDLARGLGAAHGHGVLHRDLKPSNVIISRNGEVKLLDFGLAELRDATRPAGVRTVAGTPHYMAPELRRGRPATPQSDMYSLGLILYELCTRDVPRREPRGPDAPAPVAASSLAAALPLPTENPLIQAAPGIDPDFVELIERCLRTEPAERPASADALAKELERLDRDASTLALPDGNPYRGLYPFEADHRQLFFGRDADIRAIIDRLRREPLVLIAGDSGVGKSSLCRAGILPRIAAGALDERRAFTIVTLSPGRQPFTSLAAALASVLGRKEEALRAALSNDPTWGGEILPDTYRGLRGVLLFVDQLEELLTLSQPDEAGRFVEALAKLAASASAVRVLLAVRGDFYTRLAKFPALGGNLKALLHLLPPLSPEGIREAVVGPARAQGVTFESDALITMLTASVAQDAGSLPLLQFTLAELWARRDQMNQRITRAALEDMGGVAGALSRHADGVLARLSSGQREAARSVLLRLVTAKGTRGARTESELSPTDEDTRRAVHALVEGRLLHVSPAGDDASYQIAHEALIESWGTLRGWLNEDARHREILQRLVTTSAEWELLGRPSEMLFSARQLDEALALDPSLLGPREQKYLAASHRGLQRRRYQRWAVALFLLLLAFAAYGIPLLQMHRATQHFIDERIAEAQREFEQGKAHSIRAAQLAAETFPLFDGKGGAGPKALEAAEKQWAGVPQERKRAEAAYLRADQALQIALLRDSQHLGVRHLLAELTYTRIQFDEQLHLPRREDLWQQLARLDEDGQWRRRFEAPAQLQVQTTPPDASVNLQRYVGGDDERWHLEPVEEFAGPRRAPLAIRSLKPGSYLLEFTAPGRPPIRLPLLLEPKQSQSITVVLPERVPEGYAYVPPGCFLFGGAQPEVERKSLHTVPIHSVCMYEGQTYVIGRREVTLGDWLQYLNTLDGDALARSYLAEPHMDSAGAGTYILRPRVQGWAFSFLRPKHLKSKKFWPTALEGAPFRYQGRSKNAEQDWTQFPLAGIQPGELRGYLDWLDRTHRLPGARLCSEQEWERGARGADGRLYPHGNRLLPDDADFDETYNYEPDAYGPDRVGIHPASESPFGLQDMAGNVFETVRTLVSSAEAGRFTLRSGSWYQDQRTLITTTRVLTEAELRDATVGFRLCADWPPGSRKN